MPVCRGRPWEEIDDSPSAVPPDAQGHVPTRRQAFLVCAQLQCTEREIAAMVGVSEDTIRARLRDDPEVREMLENGRANGRTSIRRALIRQMNDGNVAAAIWLSKQFLGMREPAQELVIQERVDAVTDEMLTRIRRAVDDATYERILDGLDGVGGDSARDNEGASSDPIH